jgi:uncharacterized protein YukE
VSAPSAPQSNSYHDGGEPDDHEAAVAALRAAFARLQPQGGDAWNFLAAFTHLGDRYGPYQPGASELSALVDGAAASSAATSTWKRRLRQRGDGGGDNASGSGSGSDQTELAQAMAQVVEAFRFLSARVRTLEERVAHQDRPVDGAAWLIPAPELGLWVAPVAAHVAAATLGGEVVHGDCGEGALLRAFAEVGVPAWGVEPRGTVALAAIERGHSVTVSEVADELAARQPASLGGLVLSGVVDRLPLHALVALLALARRALSPGAPLIVVVRAPGVIETPIDVVARELVGPSSLHAQTWEALLVRAGFFAVAPLEAPAGIDDAGRFALTASVRR